VNQPIGYQQQQHNLIIPQGNIIEVRNNVVNPQQYQYQALNQHAQHAERIRRYNKCGKCVVSFGIFFIFFIISIAFSTSH
jgi:hypothetical protein